MKLIHKITNWIYKKRVVEVEVNKLIGFGMVIRDRALSIIAENYPHIDWREHRQILRCNYYNVYMCELSIDDVTKFADEYGCTVDYLLGRTDTPYYML